MSIKILIKETDPHFGYVTYRSCVVTSKKLEAQLLPEQQDGKVEVYGAELNDKQLSPQEAAERGYREFRENNKDLFKK